MEKYLYKEVYVVSPDSITEVSGDLAIFDSLEDLLEYLKTKNVSINSDLRVVHGVLTSAKTIPKDLRGKQAFIILTDPGVDDHGIVLDSDSEESEELAEEVVGRLEHPEATTWLLEIEDVFILYGYELTLTLSVDDEDIDEDIIATCLTIAKEAKELYKEGN